MPDTRPLDQRDDQELIRLTRQSRGDVAKEALAVLVRREAAPTADLAAELVTGHADVQVRALAATTLGRSSDPHAREALQRAAADAEPAVVRRAAQGLVRLGDVSALPLLERIQPPVDSAAGRDVLASRMLLGYRQGNPVVLAEPGEVTSFGRRRGTTIAFGEKPRIPKRDIAASISREVPALASSTSAVEVFNCSGVRGAIAIDSEQPIVGPADLVRPRLLGALFRERICSDRYTLDAFVLSDDRDDTGGTRPRVWVVRPSGHVLHGGYARVAAGKVSFTIDESVAPFAAPVRVTGRLDDSGSIVVESAQVGKPATEAARAVEPRQRSRVMR